MWYYIDKHGNKFSYNYYPSFNDTDGMTEISAEEYWGNGIMTDAVKQICEYVFENSDILRIYAEPFAYNIGSCRVLEKAGFQYEGTLRNNAVKNGKVIDMKMYSLLREEQ